LGACEEGVVLNEVRKIEGIEKIIELNFGLWECDPGVVVPWIVESGQEMIKKERIKILTDQSKTLRRIE
jgi:hypothetical protein